MRKLRRLATMVAIASAANLHDRLRGDGGAMVRRLHIKHQSEWTLASPDSLFTIAGHSGHMVHRDDPGLVVSMVRHVDTKATQAK